ncbi:Metallopeptidase, family M24 [Candidatus Rhodobacter oscarellae]|uniref:Metallopeptidase, family M24 n=1 Tax=Candidatus Rhodobacter oscarellae TaxID=1675527 RepID=A0A0J9EDD4_9RHOB|nr:Xaa-Pro peptidase family protein [Candidatus Rhodobacter lobularis]KMW60822.1 Metallopeptidase, family M24 [Candidatus Rhodobacter lobularis]
MIFPAAEFQGRVARLQARMADAGIDALLLTTPPDVFYVTGFLTRFWESPARPWFVIVPAKGAPVAVIPSIGAGLMGKTWLSDIRTWDAPDLVDDGVSLLASTLGDLVPDTGAVGLHMGLETHLRMPLADYERLRAALAPRHFADATGLVQRVREVKSEAEIDRIRQTCAIAGRAFDRVPEIAGAGAPLERVFRDFQRLLLEEGAEWVSYLAGGAGPGGYGDVISPASDRPLARGDVLMLDTGAVREGYFCDFDRNWAVGGADDASRRAYDRLYAATEAGLAAARPGMTAGGLYRAMAAVTGDVSGRIGHGLGLSLTEWPSLIPSDRTELRAGMVLTLEPWVEIAPGRMMVHEENVVIREGAAELLSPRAAAELPVI